MVKSNNASFVVWNNVLCVQQGKQPQDTVLMLLWGVSGCQLLLQFATWRRKCNAPGKFPLKGPKYPPAGKAYTCLHGSSETECPCLAPTASSKKKNHWGQGLLLTYIAEEGKCKHAAGPQWEQAPLYIKALLGKFRIEKGYNCWQVFVAVPIVNKVYVNPKPIYQHAWHNASPSKAFSGKRFFNKNIATFLT